MLSTGPPTKNVGKPGLAVNWLWKSPESPDNQRVYLTLVAIDQKTINSLQASKFNACTNGRTCYPHTGQQRLWAVLRARASKMKSTTDHKLIKTLNPLISKGYSIAQTLCPQLGEQNPWARLFAVHSQRPRVTCGSGFSREAGDAVDGTGSAGVRG